MDKYCITDQYTIKEAMAKIELNAARCVIVLKNNKVIGTISQGDVIRALQSNIDIYNAVTPIINSSFLYLNQLNMNKAYSIFKKKNISLLPVVDENFALVDVVTIERIFDYLENNKEGELK